MYTSIFPFKKVTTDTDSRKHDYWAVIDSPAHNIQRVLAFGSFDKLKDFLKSGVFENGTTVDLRPYTLERFQSTSFADYPPELLKYPTGRKQLSDKEFAECQFYMGHEKAQTVANGLEARLQRKFSDEEMRTIIAALGSIPVKNGLKNGNGHDKHNGVYLTLPNITLNDLVDIYLRSLTGLSNGVPSDLINVYLMSLAENGAKPSNGSPYSMTSLVEEDTNPDNRSPHEKARDCLLASERFNRIVIGALLKNGTTQMPKNGIMHETSKSYSPLAALVLIAVYSAIFRMDREKRPDNESNILDELDLPQPDEIKVPVKHANGLDAIARMAEKLTGRIEIDLSQKPFG